MAGRGGGILHELIVHPIKSLLGLIFGLAIILTLMLPASDAISTVGAISVTIYRAGGVMLGSIPPGITAFKQGFTAMSNYVPKASDWNAAAASKPKPAAPKKG